jgi:hypothetical protein
VPAELEAGGARRQGDQLLEDGLPEALVGVDPLVAGRLEHPVQGHEVLDHVEPAFGAVLDVVNGWVLDVGAAEAAVVAVTVQDLGAEPLRQGLTMPVGHLIG